MTRRVRGFSLLEILVALAIAAMSLGALYKISGNNASRTGTLDQQERAGMLARSLLQGYPTVPEAGLHDSGQSAGFDWQVQSRPFPTPVSNENASAPRLHELLVSVYWQDGSRSRELDLTTLRPERILSPGPQDVEEPEE